ncbi:MAG: hypothetical protein V1723_03095 [Candidatus Uhrbacteria bacterium]
MATVIPIARARETGNGDPSEVFDDFSSEERAAQIFEHEFPLLCNDVAMLVARPFRLIWDPTIDTACTDCLAEVRVSPWFFLNGQRDVGYGTTYHETGHIRNSPYGSELLTRAEREGGPVLRHILGILLDRKDDILIAEYAPGFAPLLRKRLAYICTMTRRKFLEGRGFPDAAVTATLKGWKPQDPYEDFFFAAKWHKSPRSSTCARAMRRLTRKRLLAASPEELLWLAKRIREILGEPADEQSRSERERQERLFLTLMSAAGLTGCGIPNKQLDPKLRNAIAGMAARYVGGLRKSGIQQLLRALKGAASGIVWPGPISVGVERDVPVKIVLPDSTNASAYQELLCPVRHLVDPLTKKLKRLDSPSEFELSGQDEGDLDLDESARIACGLGGHYVETIVERDIDAEIHLAVDCSGSMSGEKVRVAKQIGIVFAEATMTTAPACIGRLWAFSSKAVYDLGPPNPLSGIVNIEGEAGNSDTHMLRIVGTALAKSRKRRKVLLVLCDDGPDSIDEVRKLSQQLLARGIIVAHLLVGVHGTPNIYPIELPYTSMEECLGEFGEFLEQIFRNLR